MRGQAMEGTTHFDCFISYATDDLSPRAKPSGSSKPIGCACSSMHDADRWRHA